MEGNRDDYDDAKYAQDGRMLSMDQLDQLDGVDNVDQLDESLDAFANVGQGLDGEHRTEMLNYWQQAIDEIEHIAEDGNGHECFKSTALPLARIKKVMKTDSEVRMISAEAPILFAKGCDIFITELTMRAWIHAEENKRRTLQRSDIATAIQKSDVFDFLIDIVPREEAQQRKSASHHRAPHPEGGNAPTEAHVPQAAAARHPREMHYVGDSRSMNMGAPSAGPMNNAMHGLNMSSAPGSFAAGPANGVPGGLPSNIPGSIVSEGSALPPQQFTQFDNRFAQFPPQQFGSGVPPPQSLPQQQQQPTQFGQFQPQFSGGQYIPDLQNSVPQALPNMARDQQPPMSGQPQDQQQPQQSQQMDAPRTQSSLVGHQIEKDQPAQAVSSGGEPQAQRASSQDPQQLQQQPHQELRSHPSHQQPQPSKQQPGSTQPPPSPNSSPQLSQKARDPSRYDSEFQYPASYGEPVDVAFGPSY